MGSRRQVCFANRSAEAGPEVKKSLELLRLKKLRPKLRHLFHEVAQSYLMLNSERLGS
jgi:hypothetical protein